MPLSLIFLIWVIVLQTFAQAMQKLFKSTKFGVLLKNRSAIYMALTACLQSSVINGFLILLEPVEVLSMQSLAMLIKDSVKF